MKLVATSLVLLAACDGTSGTLQVTLVTSPNSPLVSQIQKLRVTTTNPSSETEADRTSNGIDLSLEVSSSAGAGVVAVQGYDASGTLIATGQSAPFALGGGDAILSIYVAEPYSINEAPVRLKTGRADLAATEIVFGAVIAGGVDGSSSLSDGISVYNVYSHALQEGAAMPSKRRGQAVGANVTGGVYLFGGAGENGIATSSFYEFISTTAPAGSYINGGDQTGFERTDEQALAVGPDMFVVTGNPPINMGQGTIAARTDLPVLRAGGAPSIAAIHGFSGTAAALRGDGLTLVTFDATTFTEHDLPAARTGGVAALPDGGFMLAGGTGTDVIRIDATGLLTQLTDILSTPRTEPSVAATPHYVVVAGGVDSTLAPIPTADILDAKTLALVATVPILPRMHTQAVAMPNEQVMLVGGDTASDVIELFTPPVATD